MRDIEIDLSGRGFRLIGVPGPIADALAVALVANGGAPAADDGAPDLLIVNYALLPEQPDAAPQLAALRKVGNDMVERGGGRMVFVLSAMASLPVRRHSDYSVLMAAALAGMRTLAMQLAPNVLVNAVGIGVIDDASGLAAGDRHMLGHAAVARAGSVDDAVNAVLFLCDPANTYTTGQILNVDGGWSAGYGRNF